MGVFFNFTNCLFIVFSSLLIIIYLFICIEFKVYLCLHVCMDLNAELLIIIVNKHNLITQATVTAD